MTLRNRPPPAYDPTDDSSFRAKKSDNQDGEEQFNKLVEQLDKAISDYKEVRKRDVSDEALKRHEHNILSLINGVVDAASDPEVKKHYREKGEKFANASRKQKENVARDIAKGLRIILIAPLALIAVAGGILYGAGMIVKGVGNVLTLGMASKGQLRFMSKLKEEPKDDWDSD